MKTAVFFGSSSRMAEIISRHFNLLAVICEPSQLSNNLYSFCEWVKIPCFLADSRQKIMELCLPKAEVAISYGCGVIFKRAQIELFESGIWNIHPGMLPDYRGRHPISWAMIEGRREIGITIHEIDEEIDRGVMLAQDVVLRLMDDTQAEIENKLEQLVDQRLFELAIRTAEEGRGQPLEKGRYLPTLEGGPGDINSSEIEADYLFNLFRSQSVYGGVMVNGVRYKGCYYYHPDAKDNLLGNIMVTCRDGKLIVLY
jgi:methionyl-tRNA formyltransferase